VIAGETGVAGLAGLLSLATDPRRRDVLGLGPDARVLLIGSEGASDPDLWHRHVGQRVPYRPART
jgi:diaminopropionate ammonia-lyase